MKRPLVVACILLGLSLAALLYYDYQDMKAAQKACRELLPHLTSEDDLERWSEVCE